MIVADGWMKKIFHKYNWLVVYGLWTSPSWAQPVEVISYEEAFSHSSVRFDGADDQAQENMPAADAPSADGTNITGSIDDGTDAAAVIPGSEASKEEGPAAKPKKTRASRAVRQKKPAHKESKASDVTTKSASNPSNPTNPIDKSDQLPAESLPNTVKSETASAQGGLASPEATKAPNSDQLNKPSLDLESKSTPASVDTAANQGSPESSTLSQESGLDPLASSPAPAISDSTTEPSHTSFTFLLMGGSLVLIGGLIAWFKVRRSKTTYLTDFDLNSEVESSAVTKLKTSKSATHKPRKEEPISTEPKFSEFSSHSFQPLSMAPSHATSKI